MFDRRLISNFDWVLLLITIGISLLGVLAIYSASKGYPGHPDYWLRQLYWLGISLGVGFLVLLVDIRTIAQWSYLFHWSVVGSLLLLLVLGGSGSSQVNRWFMVGPMAVQPSEFAKFSSVMALAYYFRDARRIGNIGVWGALRPFVIVLVPFFLIVNQPDLGTALLVLMLYFPIIVLAGLRIRLLMSLIMLLAVSVIALFASFQYGTYDIKPDLVKQIRQERAPPELQRKLEELQGRRFYTAASLRRELTSNLLLRVDDPNLVRIEERSFFPYISRVLRPYQQKRLITFLNPDQDPLGAGYHVIQSKVAVGSGGLTGKGFGNSTQGSLNFLPARHTDFIYSIFAEEWGLLGALGLLGLYLALILRSLSIILQTNDRFSAMVTVGIVSMIVYQVLINTGMAMGLLPVVGVTLPLFSYGGSSMISTMTGIALLLNIRMRRFLWN
ncbi:MAG: rod shape-determining protein RodA [Deltaproteobacteria bacterium]|nr:rod shape-determining protein RodA [Deltaproteobacteria bacterium]